MRMSGRLLPPPHVSPPDCDTGVAPLRIFTAADFQVGFLYIP